MKTKALLLVGAVAIVTLSFTFVNSSNTKTANTQSEVARQEAPIGGFGAEEVVR
jgi:hypothetical protein